MAVKHMRSAKRRYLLCMSRVVLPMRTQIYKDRFLVGSTEDADLKVPSRKIKEEHALIRTAGEYCYINALHPDGKTSVNSNVLVRNECVALRSQDDVMFGDVLYRYVEEI